jgi:hypothetical protein
MNREFGYNIRGAGDNRRLSEETKQLISQAKIGVSVHTKSSKKKISDALRGRIHTKESREKRSQKLKGYVWPDSVRDQWSITHRRSVPYPPVISPDGNVYTVTNMTRFCKEHGLNQQSMSRMIRGELNHHHQWKIAK